MPVVAAPRAGQQRERGMQVADCQPALLPDLTELVNGQIALVPSGW